jgi:subtilisin family serine protease
MKTLVTVLIALATLKAQSGEILRLKTGKFKIDAATKAYDDSLWGRVKTLIGGSNPLTEKYFVVQYVKAVTAADLSFLSEQKIDVINAMPDDALVIRISRAEQLRILQNQKAVRGIVPYRTEWKLSPELALSSQRESTPVQVRLLSPEDEGAFQNFLRQNNIAFVELSHRNFYLNLPPSQMSAVSSRVEVEWVEPWTRFHTMEFRASPGAPVNGAAGDLTGLESGTRLIGFEKAWAKGLHGEGQIVGIADTGADTGNISTLLPDLSAITDGFCVSQPEKGWADSQGHGTHVSGSVVGNGANSAGKVLGGAYGARLVVQSLVGDDEVLRLPSPAAILTQAMNKGVRVHSNSWGSNSSSYDNTAAEYDEFIWNHPDLLVLFAAGNSGADRDRNGVVDENSVATPGTAKNVLTVGASENQVSVGGLQMTMGQYSSLWPVPPLSTDVFSDNPRGIAGFSSRGPTDDGRRKPDLVAPGTNILSTRSQVAGASVLWGAFNDSYVFSGGTSMATPIAAGAAVVVRQYLVSQLNMRDPSAALIKAVMMHTADDLFPGQYGTGKTQEISTPRPNNVEGFGRVDVAAATNLEGVKVFDEKTGVKSGEQKDVSLTLTKGQRLSVTLNYTDYPGLVSSSQALVNDLDVAVTSPDGRVIRVDDHVNNNEYLDVAAAEAGVYKVSVVGTRIVRGKDGRQPYALVLSIH